MTPRFYIATAEKKLIFLHSCEIKSGSGLEMRLEHGYCQLQKLGPMKSSEDKMSV